eukprot:Nitzschia sp. Nitz4//scaffold206_size41850//27157//28839//NITZ4_007425-RA/size41850-augustus-gene-0.62-mRNA-1//-1//CDS//3329541574//1539//frame0
MVQVHVVSDGDESEDISLRSSSLQAEDDDHGASSCTNTTIAFPANPDFILQEERKSPCELDILCGRGRGVYNHPGNRRLLDIVASFKEEYRIARKKNKCKVVHRVLDIVLFGYPEPAFGAKSSGRGGFKKPLKFWRRAEEEGGETYSSVLSSNAPPQWVELSEIEAQKKVAHTLREARLPQRSAHFKKTTLKMRRGGTTTPPRSTSTKKQSALALLNKNKKKNNNNKTSPRCRPPAVPVEIVKNGTCNDEEKTISASSISTTTTIKKKAPQEERIPPQVWSELDALDLDLLEVITSSAPRESWMRQLVTRAHRLNRCPTTRQQKPSTSNTMDDHRLEGMNSLVTLAGVTVPARARFVGEALVGASVSSLTLGLTAGMFGAMSPVGPLVPFLFGSWTGYSFGLMRHWQASRKYALDCAKDYPLLLGHALNSDQYSCSVPRSIVDASEEHRKQVVESREDEDESSASPFIQWIEKGGLGRMSWVILAAQNCRADIDELHRMERQKMVEQYADQ